MMENNSLLKCLKDLATKMHEIHPLFERLYPLAVLKGKKLYIYRVDQREYFLYKKINAPEWLPQNVMAAFPLKENNYNITCVISSDALENLEKIVLVLHEFVHCYQFETYEEILKKNLDIFRIYMEKGVYDWEITHPFPYDSPYFVEAYNSLLLHVQNINDAKVVRRKLRKILDRIDFEYMVWVEWKEGFARYIENKIRRILRIAENHIGREKPYTRLTFYEGGAKLIEILIKNDEKLYLDIKQLFYEIKNL